MDPALENAIRVGDLEGLKTALQNGANPNQGDEVYTPLTMLAEDPPAENGLEMIRLLLEKGADANLKDSSDDPKIPLEYAVASLSGVVNQKKYYPNEDQYKKDVKECKAVIKILCQVTNYDEVERLKKKYPMFANLLKCQVSKVNIARRLGVVETALDNAAIRTYPQQTPYGVELPHVMKNVKDYVGFKNVGPGGRRRNTKKHRKTTKRRKTLKKF